MQPVVKKQVCEECKHDKIYKTIPYKGNFRASVTCFVCVNEKCSKKNNYNN